MSHTLAPLIASILNDLPEAFECTLRHEAACQVLIQQCAGITAHIEAAKARIAKEKAAQRLLRAEIAAFLRERGELRSASTSMSLLKLRWTWARYEELTVWRRPWRWL